MLWKSLIVWTGCESPVVVVLSGSMEPLFYRGDLLVLTHHRDIPIVNGEIVVYKLSDREIPIVHRVVKRHENSKTGEIKYLTKGDNNRVDDRGLYSPGMKWIKPEHILGRARGQCPYIGYVTVILNDYPKLKLVVILLVGVSILIRREDP